jgi:predicted RNase H-like HicB family nuclease
MTVSTHTYHGYVFTIDHRPEPIAYPVDFPDIQEIITSGSSLTEAFGNACEALDLHLENLQKLGKRPPKVKRRMVLQ